MDMIFAVIGFYFMPILAIIFCVNLVEIIKKVKNEQQTTTNTFWMTTAFMLIVWTISVLVIATS
ncbi:hypothetical protein QTL97_00255 [Sporosarcina thermotolerans]|uniref:PCZ2.2 n=1 Tax=Sporosarcina thermotolerans TaxID=633404 RepID=A0AAW9A6X4_9BACL|nr:hypothetical protein [Sporosarcina thermotolerans]MDW0115371.1 hypothetical protein [Sporosarcina thermotolerans]WHT47286.1 hypothetical protein QNH10_13855 [Sporosarcina thermotolerans]